MTTLTDIGIIPYASSSKIFGEGHNFFGSLGIAEKLGHKTATVIQQIHFWMKDVYSSYDILGVRFINKTYEQLSEYFKIGVRTIRRVIRRLEDLKILISIKDNYSSKSYTLNYEKLCQFLNLRGGGQNVHLSHAALSSLCDDSVEKIIAHEAKILEEVSSKNNADFLHTPVAILATLPYKYIFNTYNSSIPRLMDQTEDSAQTPVVSFFEKVLDGWRVSKSQIRSWLSRYGKQYVEEKVHLTEKSNPRTPGAFLNAALKFDWQPADKAPVALKSTQENPMHTTLPFMPTDEENRHWYQSLTEKQKLGLYEDACHMWPMLGYHFKSANVTPIDENLNNSYVFNLFMEQIGRRKAKTLQDVIREEREGVA